MTNTPTPDKVLRLLRNIPMGYVGERRTSSFACSLSRAFRVPLEDARQFASEEPEKISEELNRWLETASPRDRLLGVLDALMDISETETIDTDEGDAWGKRFAERVHQSFLLPEDEALATFHADTPHTGRWGRAVIERTADAILNGPRLAAFVIAFDEDGKVAATTRAADRGERGIGLPGGKLDAGETAAAAALREAAEEGWEVSDVWSAPVHIQEIGDFRCAWFVATPDPRAVMLSDFKEKGRITPVAVDPDDLNTPGLGNDNALRAYDELVAAGPVVSGKTVSFSDLTPLSWRGNSTTMEP